MIVIAALIGSLSVASAEGFRLTEVPSAANVSAADVAPGTVVFSDREGGGHAKPLIGFADWAGKHPAEKKFLALFPGYAEPTVTKPGSDGARRGPAVEKLSMYVAQARFVIDRPADTLDLARYVTLGFLQQVDPAIKHRLITPAELKPLNDVQGAGNANPQRKWCTGRAALICVQSSYRLEGKIPLGIMLANKLRDSAKKISDHIDFEGELSQIPAADLDQSGVQELTGLNTPVVGVLEQNIFYVNQIMKFGKLFAVFQQYPGDPGKTVVTSFVALAIESSVLDKKKEFEHVPVLRNLVPAQVLMGESSFNSGSSISAGLPKYARNEILTIAGLLEADKQ
jgi:hypothetical protein